MAPEKAFPVYGDNGLKGTLFAAARFIDSTPEKRVVFDDGREITVPANALEAQPDGSFYLRYSLDPAPAPVQALPAAAAPDAKQVFYTQPALDQLYREDCEIRRVPIQRLIDSPVDVRYEGETMIVPLVEEILVVEKRLMLREELYITRRREPKASEAPIPREELEPD